jgi:uncharacterized protein with von Willebrand factor type A (vWA) domain
MFTAFFYYLRSSGLNISLNEWLSFMEALDQGLCNSLMDFYQLCRAILIKSEADYDKFDLAFAEFFKDIQSIEDIPEEVWQWLDKDLSDESLELGYDNLFPEYDLDELRSLLAERLAEQKEEHNGGNYWIGTNGTSAFGHSGYHPGGIRIGGKSRHLSAIQVASERRFRDFRKDATLDIRHFQMAFRSLRELSSKVDGAKTELDIDETINETCKNAGMLKLVWDRPRTNTIKLLLLMDSDGSMWPYSRLCNQLFQAAHKSSHFKDLKVFYFHNCIYENLYKEPTCIRYDWVDTEWVLNNYGSEYRLILVGDASMGPFELTRPGGNIVFGLHNKIPGINWLKKVRNHYPHSIWLNPIPKDNWPYMLGSFTIKKIGEIFPMFDLTLEGLEEGIKKLKVSR